MLWSIYCFCITRSQRRDEKGIWEEMWNNSVQSVLEQKVKRWNILYNCNRIGLETELRLSPALPRELSPRPQGKEFRLQCTRLHAWPTPRLEPLRGKWVTIMCPAPKTSNRLADHGFSASFFRQRLDLQMKHYNTSWTDLYDFYVTPAVPNPGTPKVTREHDLKGETKWELKEDLKIFKKNLSKTCTFPSFSFNLIYYYTELLW